MPLRVFMRTAFLKDQVTGAVYALPRRTTRCACCGKPYTKGARGASLVLDHTWLPRGGYFLTILCASCNSRKQDRRFVSLAGGKRWYPGMRRTPKPRKAG